MKFYLINIFFNQFFISCFFKSKISNNGNKEPDNLAKLPKYIFKEFTLDKDL